MMLLVKMYNYNLPWKLCEPSAALLFRKDAVRHLAATSTLIPILCDVYDTVESLPMGLSLIGFYQSSLVDPDTKINVMLTNEAKKGKERKGLMQCNDGDLFVRV